MKPRKHADVKPSDGMSYLVLFEDETILPLTTKPNSKEVRKILRKFKTDARFFQVEDSVQLWEIQTWIARHHPAKFRIGNRTIEELRS